MISPDLIRAADSGSKSFISLDRSFNENSADPFFLGFG